MILALVLAFSVPAFVVCHTIDVSQVLLDVTVNYVVDDVSKVVAASKLKFDANGEVVLSTEDGTMTFVLKRVNDETATLEVISDKEELFGKHIVLVAWGKKVCGLWLDEEGKPLLTITIVVYHSDHGDKVEAECDSKKACKEVACDQINACESAVCESDIKSE